MPDSDIEAAIAHWAPRSTTQGVDPNDFRRVTASLDHWADWLDAWCANGDMHAGIASEAESLGRNLTAGQAWMRAALSYHFAKFVWVLDMKKHRLATTKSVDAMRHAHKLLDPAAERIEIPFEGTKPVGNLRRPLAVARLGLVLLLHGLDSTKEEFFNWENVFLQRGMATFSLDGPGQGETGYELPLRTDYEVASTAAIDSLLQREDIDLGCLGVVGVSMGGYYAAGAAAFDHRIRAATTPQEANEIANRMTLEGVLGKLVQPLLVIFGRKDRLVPYQYAERVVREAPNAQLMMFEEGNHVCNNLPYRYQPLAGDWMAEKLGGGAS